MHRSTRVPTLSLVITAAIGLLAGAAAAASPPRAHAPIVVYVDRNGGTVSAGDDDSHRGTSSLVQRGPVKIPAWRGGEGRWRAVMSCVRDRFSAFDLDIVEDRPQRGDYIMAMVGGRPNLLGFDHDISGIAPYTGSVMPNAIVYIFAAGVDYDVEITCVDVLHEVGHALGLDHEYLCQDPMSYLWDCEEPKTFQDVAASCGEDEPRACENGDRGQNSYAILARNVGLRAPEAPSVPPPASRPPAPGPADDPAIDGPGDGPADPPTATATRAQPPSLGVSLEGPRGVMRGNRVVSVTVHGRGGSLSDASLAWLVPDGRYTFDCASMPAGRGASCRRRGDDFVFDIEVGTGWRYFAAIVVGAAGQTATSDPASAYFE